jgi:hypothetical protein
MLHRSHPVSSGAWKAAARCEGIFARAFRFLAIAVAVVAGCIPFAPVPAHAAIGCTLTNPAQDLKYLYPEMTTYREELREFRRFKDGKALYDALKERLGSDLDPVYETYDTPYTVYTIFKGKQVIGIVHGVNVPGQGGVIQVFLSADPQTGNMRQAFFQRLESVAARALRNKDFLAQFRNLTLADFYRHDYYKSVEPGNPDDRVARITSPVSDEKGRKDFEASLRGVRKNLILLDIFVYDRKFEPVYQETRQGLARAGKIGG